MALDATELFTDLGKIILASNTVGTDLAATDGLRSAIVTAFDTSGQTHNLGSLDSIHSQLLSGQTQYRSSLVNVASLRLADRSSVLNELNLRGSAIPEVLAALIEWMVDNSSTVLESTPSVGSVSADGGNVGNGNVIVDGTLDGKSAPRSGVVAHPNYLGVDSLLLGNETHTFVVSSDSYSNGRTIGAEQLTWDGEAQRSSPWRDDQSNEGSGPGPTIIATGGNNVLTGGGFDSWSGGVPAGWTVDSGTPVEETSTVLRGAGSLEATAAFKVSQSVSLVPGARYAVTGWYNVTATGSLGVDVGLEGTGYSAGSGEAVALTTVTTGAWRFFSCWLNVPLSPPSDLAFFLEIDGAPPSAGTIYFDGVALTRATYHGGVCAVASAGDTAWVNGDKYTCAVTNDNAGVIQTWFRRAYGVQLPVDASPSIADSLAT